MAYIHTCQHCGAGQEQANAPNTEPFAGGAMKVRRCDSCRKVIVIATACGCNQYGGCTHTEAQKRGEPALEERFSVEQIARLEFHRWRLSDEARFTRHKFQLVLANTAK